MEGFTGKQVWGPERELAEVMKESIPQLIFLPLPPLCTQPVQGDSHFPYDSQMSWVPIPTFRGRGGRAEGEKHSC